MNSRHLRTQTITTTKMSDLHPSSKPNPMDTLAVGQYAREIYAYRKSILFFIEQMWGLVPQEVKPEYAEKWEEVKRSAGETWDRLCIDVSPEWFGDLDVATGEWKWHNFVKGKNLTWQQTLVLMGIEKARAGDSKKNISVRSGHGVGKSAVCSWIIIWFLYCFQDAQVPCTAPTSHQMHDVLWKELAKWLARMPDVVKEVFEWQSDYLRVRYSPETWFARARTSTKENTEAIAGVHSDHVLIVVDEASGVPEQVFNTAEGALTSGNVLVVLISNPTQLIGYFFDSHHKNAADWQNLAFNGEHSPIVDVEYVERIAGRHGKDSDEYKIRVKGEFPGEGIMDDSGYIHLFSDKRITVMPVLEGVGDIFIGRRILGIDPAGEGKDKATFVIRDQFKAQKVHELVSSNDKMIARDALTLMDRYKVLPEDVVVGAFGTGADVGKEIAIATQGRANIYTVMEGNAPKDEEEYNGNRFTRHGNEMLEDGTDLHLNIRSLMYFRANEWVTKGGILLDSAVDNSPFKNELLVIRYRRSLQGNRIQLMSKKEMQKLRIPSPNIGDAFSLTFLRDLSQQKQTKEERERIEAEEQRIEDQFSPV